MSLKYEPASEPQHISDYRDTGAGAATRGAARETGRGSDGDHLLRPHPVQPAESKVRSIEVVMDVLNLRTTTS